MKSVFDLAEPLGADEPGPHPARLHPGLHRRAGRRGPAGAGSAPPTRAFAADRDILLIEGTGHAGVGAVIGLSNAVVAAMLGAPAVIVSRGRRRPADRRDRPQRRAVRAPRRAASPGAIVNKVDLDAKPGLARTLEQGLARHGIPLLGVLPYRPILSNPTLAMVLEGVHGETIHPGPDLDQVIGGVAIGAMEPEHMLQRIGPRSLVIVPGRSRGRHRARSSTPTSTAATAAGDALGLVLTGGYRPRDRRSSTRSARRTCSRRSCPRTRTRSRRRSTTCWSRPTPPTSGRSRRSRRSSGSTSFDRPGPRGRQASARSRPDAGRQLAGSGSLSMRRVEPEADRQREQRRTVDPVELGERGPVGDRHVVDVRERLRRRARRASWPRSASARRSPASQRRAGREQRPVEDRRRGALGRARGGRCATTARGRPARGRSGRR